MQQLSKLINLSLWASTGVKVAVYAIITDFSKFFLQSFIMLGMAYVIQMFFGNTKTKE